MITPQALASSATTDLAEETTPTPESPRPWLNEFGRIPVVHDLSEPFAHVPETTTVIVLRTEDHGPRAAFVLGPRTKAS